MRKFKIIIQKWLFNEDEIITDINRTITEEFTADNYTFYRDFLNVTEDNKERVNDLFNKSYEVGDIHYNVIERIDFYKNDEEIKSRYIMGDPYFKLYEDINGEFILIETNIK